MTGQWKDICNFSGEKTLLFSAKLLDHLWKERCSRFYFFFVVPSSVGAQKDGKNSGTRTLELLEETWCPGYQLGQTNGKPTWNLTMPKEKHRKKPSNFWGFHVYIHSKYDIYIYACIYIYTHVYIYIYIYENYFISNTHIFTINPYYINQHVNNHNFNLSKATSWTKRPVASVEVYIGSALDRRPSWQTMRAFRRTGVKHHGGGGLADKNAESRDLELFQNGKQQEAIMFWADENRSSDYSREISARLCPAQLKGLLSIGDFWWKGFT